MENGGKVKNRDSIYIYIYIFPLFFLGVGFKPSSCIKSGIFVFFFISFVLDMEILRFEG